MLFDDSASMSVAVTAFDALPMLYLYQTRLDSKTLTFFDIAWASELSTSFQRPLAFRNAFVGPQTPIGRRFAGGLS